MTSATSVELTEEQQEAVALLKRLERQVQTLGGYAGTGKSTVIRRLLAELPGFAACAFTGKAANVLRRKGIPARTVHSLIYDSYETEEWDDEAEEVVKELHFSIKTSDRLALEGFIVDEASMIGRALDADLRSFGLPIIYVGDHGQLEPVADRGYNLMAKPDVTLETIHRNAGYIPHFAQHLRNGWSAVSWKPPKGMRSKSQVHVISASDWHDWTGDQIICAFNRTRVAANKARRETLGYPPDRPTVGDRVMCLQNSRELGLWNGMQGRILKIDERQLTFKTDERIVRVRYIPEQFGSEKRLEGWDSEKRLPFDYCYAITCHKAQGDEWDSVLVLEERCGAWSHSRWAYTAASRARKQLTWIAD